MERISSDGREFPVAPQVVEILYARATTGIISKYPGKAHVIYTFVGVDNETNEPISFTGYIPTDHAINLIRVTRQCVADIPTHLK